MKIADTAAGADSNSAFTIAATGKAFKILSDGLYSDKIKAIIRELSCNARDSHVAAGNADPFVVHLPDETQPWFAVEDHGVGLSEADVLNIYTRYFASTKTNSDDFVGQLGLGSKSPFSYTNQFTVVSRHAGVGTTYEMSIDSTGTPRAAKLASGPCQGTGVSVQFRVAHDFKRWQDKAMEVLQWFDQKPLIANSQYQLTLPDPAEPMHRGSDWRIYRESHWNGSSLTALMGGVLYPIDIGSIPGLEGHAPSLQRVPCVIDFDIGQLDVAASREGLSYDQRTCDNIAAKLNKVYTDLHAEMQSRITAAPSKWKARMVLNEYVTTPFSYQLGRAIRDSETFPHLEYDGEPLTSTTVGHDTLNLYGLGDVTARVHSAGMKVVRKLQTFNLRADAKTVFMFDDCDKGGFARAKQWHIEQDCNNTVVVFPKNTVSWNQLAQRLEGPDIVWTSSLPAPAKAPKRVISKIWRYRGNGGGKHAFAPIKMSDVQAGPKLFVELKAWDVVMGGRELNGYSIGSAFDNLRRLGLVVNETVYALRKNDIKKLDRREWTNLHDHARAKAATLLRSKEVRRTVKNAGVWERLRNEVNSNLLKLSAVLHYLRDMVREPDSEIMRFLAVLEQHKDTGDHSINQYQWASQWFSIPLDDGSDEVPHEIKDAKRIDDKYSMIKHLNLGYGQPSGNMLREIAAYIDAVDVSHTFLMLSKPED